MKIRSLAKISGLSGRKVLLRVDFNVPLVSGKIKDDYRIKAGLETIEFLLHQGASVIIMSHLGDPAGMDETLSLRPVAARLKSLLHHPVKFIPENSGQKAQAAVAAMADGEVIMLENLRFNAGEYENDRKFAAGLAALADIYVNDAFSVSHRNQASVSAIKKYLPAYAGLLLEKEVMALNKVLKPKKPLVAVMGGAKIKTKAPLIAKLYSSASYILIGGALANNFFKFQGLEIGKSVSDQDSAVHIKKFFKRKKLSAKIILPMDVVVKTRNGQAKVKLPEAVKKTDTILDIGPATILAFSSYIRQANTLVWNGPLGKFEDRAFQHGTMGVAHSFAAVSSGRAYGVVGGGETVEALNRSKMTPYIDWVSTAGGAMLAYLGGEKLPGLKKIIS